MGQSPASKAQAGVLQGASQRPSASHSGLHSAAQDSAGSAGSTSRAMRARLAATGSRSPRGGGASGASQSPRSKAQAGVLQAGSQWALPRSL